MIAKTRTRLAVEVVVYRIVDVQDDGGGWAEQDTDVAGEEVIAEGTIETGTYDSESNDVTYDARTGDQIRMEEELQTLADRLTKHGEDVLPTWVAKHQTEVL